MKRFLSVLLLVFSLFFLASCDLFKKGPKEEPRVELDLTVEQMQALVEDVDFSKVADDIVEIKADIDLRVGLTYDSNELENPAVGEATVNGGFELYINLKTFDDSYVYAKANLTVDLDFNLEDFSSEINEEDIQEFLKFKDLSLLLEAWLIKGVLYIEGAFDFADETITINQYEELFTEEEFDQTKEMLETLVDEIDFGELDFNDIFGEAELEEVPEGLLEELEDLIALNAYQIGDSYLFELKTTTKLEDLFNLAFDFIGDLDGVSVELIEDKEFENSASVQFSDKLEKLALQSEVDVTVRLDVEEDDQMLEVSVYFKAGLSVNLQSEMPNEPPSESRFADFEEGIDLSELFGGFENDKEPLPDFN